MLLKCLRHWAIYYTVMYMMHTVNDSFPTTTRQERIVACRNDNSRKRVISQLLVMLHPMVTSNFTVMHPFLPKCQVQAVCS